MSETTPRPHWNFVIERHPGSDVQALLTEALVAGLEVRHSTRNVEDWASIEGEPGYYRAVGNLTYSKSTRRWRIVARADCGPTELASLISRGLAVLQVYGSSPGHYTRKREFDHVITSSGERIATAHCAIKLDLRDLQVEQRGALEVPDTVHELLSLTA